MNITNCPQCGGRVRSVSIGWKCESCQGFIDMRGEFHQHKEEPFMPPTTNANRIRAMSDEKLAEWLACPICKYASCKKTCPAILPNADPCEIQILSWLQQPAEEDAQ